MDMEELEELRGNLNELIMNSRMCLYEGEILKMSQKLDELINAFEKTRKGYSMN